MAAVCACRHLRERVGLFNQIGIPAAIAKASFDGFRAGRRTTRAPRPPPRTSRASSARTRRRRATSSTAARAGKTHLLAATLRYLALEKGVASRYVEFMLLLSDIRAGFDAKHSHMETLRPLLSVPVLAIDGWRGERGTEWERSMLDELISRRFNSGLATIFATNYPRRALPPRSRAASSTRSPEFQRDAEAMTLAQRVGDRIYSRLNEMCSFVKLDPGHDLRKDRHGSGHGFWGQ